MASQWAKGRLSKILRVRAQARAILQYLARRLPLAEVASPLLSTFQSEDLDYLSDLFPSIEALKINA